MGERSIAKTKLQDARFFAKLASESRGQKRDEFRCFLEAAITSGRSVMDYLSSEYKSKEKWRFDKWFKERKKVMEGDPVYKFFKSTRDYIVHQGMLKVRKAISICIHEQIRFEEKINVRIIRGNPWYRRSPKILWKDFFAPVNRLMSKYRGWKKGRKEIRDRCESNVQASEGYYFDNVPWEGREVCDLLSEYLDKLEGIVSEAEELFCKERTIDF